MSREFPIIAVTGSSGAGTTTVKRTFERMFAREDVHAAFIDGDAFHRYSRAELAAEVGIPEALLPAVDAAGLGEPLEIGGDQGDDDGDGRDNDGHDND